MNRKTVLISGAAGNLGKAIVHYFLQKGWNVAGLVHHPQQAQPTSEHYREYTINLLDEKAAEQVVAECVQTFGSIEAGILTAGGFTMGNIAHTSAEDIVKQFKLNFETAYNIARPLLKQMQHQEAGKIFFTGSGQGMDTRKGKAVVAYSLSKSLLFQLAQIINADTKDSNVRAFVLVPSIIDTPQNRESMPDANFAVWEKPENIARIVHQFTENPHQQEDAAIVIQKYLLK